MSRKISGDRPKSPYQPRVFHQNSMSSKQVLQSGTVIPRRAGLQQTPTGDIRSRPPSPGPISFSSALPSSYQAQSYQRNGLSSTLHAQQGKFASAGSGRQSLLPPPVIVPGPAVPLAHPVPTPALNSFTNYDSQVSKSFTHTNFQYSHAVPSSAGGSTAQRQGSFFHDSAPDPIASREQGLKRRRVESSSQVPSPGKALKSSRHIHLLEVIEFLRQHRPNDYPRFVADCSALYSEKYSQRRRNQILSDASRGGGQRPPGTPMRTSTPGRPSTPARPFTPLRPMTPSRPSTPGRPSTPLRSSVPIHPSNGNYGVSLQPTQSTAPFIAPQQSLPAVATTAPNSLNGFSAAPPVAPSSLDQTYQASSTSPFFGSSSTMRTAVLSNGVISHPLPEDRGLCGLPYVPGRIGGHADGIARQLHERYMAWERAKDSLAADLTVKGFSLDILQAISFLELSLSPSAAFGVNGCILTDAVGAKKVETIFTFAQRYLHNHGSNARGMQSRILIVVPDLSLDIWRAKSAMIPTSIDVMLLSAELSDGNPEDRVSVYVNYLRDWAGIMIIQLSTYIALVTCEDLELDSRARSNRTVIKDALIQPGADVVILDEAYRLRMMDQPAARALRRVETSRRVAITGASVADNLFEYWAMADWAVPGVFGSSDQFSELLVRRIARGHREDSLPKEREVARRCAWLFCNQLKPLAIPLSRTCSLPASAMHITIYVHLDPVQALCYVAAADTLRKCVREGTIDRAMGARVLQVAASHSFALESILSSLKPMRLPERHGSSSAFAELERASRIFDVLSKRVADILAQNERPGLKHPSSKLLVLIKLLEVFRQRGERIVVFADTIEVQRAMFTGLRSALEQRGNNPDSVFLCDSSQSQKARALELDGWRRASHGAALLTVIGPISDDVEMAGWTFSGVSRIVIVDCSWTTSHRAQILGRIVPSSSQPLFVYDLVAAGTCEKLWDTKHLSVLSPDEPLFAENVDFLIDREVTHLSFQPPSRSSWDFAKMPLIAPKAPVNRGITESVIAADKSCGNIIGKLLSLQMDRGMYVVHEIHTPRVGKLAMAPHVLFHGLYSLSTTDMSQASKEYEEALLSYLQLAGTDMWEGIERRPTRDNRMSETGSGVLDIVERQNTIIPASSKNHECASTTSLYLAMLPHWDMFSRQYMRPSNTNRALNSSSVTEPRKLGRATHVQDQKSRAPLRANGFADGNFSRAETRGRDGFEVEKRGRVSATPLSNAKARERVDRRAIAPAEITQLIKPGAGRGIGLTVPAWAKARK